MIDREKVIKGLKCCTSQGYSTCSDCPYDPECNKLAKDALEVLTGQEREQPEKIETGKMKICGLRSETKADGRFNNYPDVLRENFMSFTWRDIKTCEMQELSMTIEEWIRFSKEITEAVARFKMEG